MYRGESVQSSHDQAVTLHPNRHVTAQLSRYGQAVTSWLSVQWPAIFKRDRFHLGGYVLRSNQISPIDLAQVLMDVQTRHSDL